MLLQVNFGIRQAGRGDMVDWRLYSEGLGGREVAVLAMEVVEILMNLRIDTWRTCHCRCQ